MDNGKVVKEVRGVDGRRFRVSTANTEPSMTDQQFQKECDVNEIMAKAKRGIAPHHLKSRPGFFADVSQYPDLGEAMQAVTLAREEFEKFPSDLRARFGNDPRVLVEFLKDTANDDEAVRLGLKVRPVKEDPEDKPLTAKQMRSLQKEQAAPEKGGK